jgi:hypothetical protein
MKKPSAQDLIANMERLHTTTLGKGRIQKNLGLDVKDVVGWCAKQICNESSNIFRKGKNWYITTAHCEITVNANSYTIITAHKIKEPVTKHQF